MSNYLVWSWVFILLLAACSETSPAKTESALPTAETEDELASLRDADVPALPFEDNPDPTKCGIPEQWFGEKKAWLNGIYEGEMLQETVLLYSSHNRLSITARAPHGTPVEILMYQNNPVLDYYLVKLSNAPKGENQGWIPAPLLSFEPISGGG